MAEETIEGWLTDSYDYERPHRGQVREGVVLRVERQGVIVDVGLKREGIVPHKDVERLGKAASSQLKPGQEVAAYILRPEDRDGNLILSLFRAQLAKDWDRANAMLESGDVWRGKITGYNKGGLTAEFGRLNGFVPGSHLWAQEKRRLSSDQREELFMAYVGQELPLKVIEVDRGRRRLILSERLARQALRKRRREDLLDELLEGQVIQGTVSRLCDFGAFVDVGGADGLIHISELAWRRVSHPREVLQVGDEIDVYVLRLDHKRKRIGLSLKRTQPDPWSWVELNYEEGELVFGVVTGVADFGAFAGLEIGVEGLIHVSELADPPPENPRMIVRKGDELVLRILRIEPSRHRIALSLNRVSPEERDEWLGRADADQPDTAAEESDAMAVDDAASVEDVPTSVDVPLVEDEEAQLELVAVMRE